MKTRTMSVWFAFAVLMALGGVSVAPAPLGAQQERTECRCVDADGNELDNCSCLRSPEIEGLLSRYGVGARPRIGVSVDQGQSARFDTDGARISEVLRGGPADEAGLREGDIIVSIDGRTLTESIGADRERAFDLDGSAPVQRLLALARSLRPGEEVEIEYLRDGELESTVLRAEDLSDRWGSGNVFARPTWDADRFRDQMRTLTDGLRGNAFFYDGADQDVRIRLQGRDGGDVRILGGPSLLFGDGFSQHGLQLVELNPGLGAYFGAEAGVLVIDVHDSSELGLRAGDVILRVGDRMVETPDRVRRIVASYGVEEEINFRVLRDGDEITVTGLLGR